MARSRTRNKQPKRQETWRESAIAQLKQQLPTFIQQHDLDNALKCVELIDQLKPYRFGYLPPGIESGAAVRERGSK